MNMKKAQQFTDELRQIRNQPMGEIILYGIIAICYCILAVAYEVNQIKRHGINLDEPNESGGEE